MFELEKCPVNEKFPKNNELNLFYNCNKLRILSNK